jgi:AraC family transcriptional regulator of adaptative response / DNA-3-methyladenine glycosylase II
MLEFLGARAIPGVERVDELGYRRTLALRHKGGSSSGWIAVTRSTRRHSLIVHVSASLARVVPKVLARLRHAFDLACDPVPVAATLGELAAAHPGLRVPGTCDPFELSVRAIVGQQISVAGARTLLQWLADRFGSPLEGAAPTGLRGA